VLSLLSGPALALPTTFEFVSGQAHVTASVVGQSTLLVDTVVALDGTFVDFETAPVGVADFELSIAPTGPIAMNGSYGGFDTFVIESALLVPGAGFSSSGVAVGGTEYSIVLGPLDVNAVYGASHSSGSPGPVSGVSISFTNPSLSATVSSDTMTFEMIGVTLGIIPGALVGEAADLIVKGDITFVGAPSAPIPEAGTGALLATGLVALAAARRRS
jgi:hypothetical protein